MENYIEKIDSLGRILIPEEIRKKYDFNTDNYIEFIEGSNFVALKNYSLLSKYKNLSQILVNTLNYYLNVEAFITDKHNIIAYAGVYKDKYINKPISKYLKGAIKRRESIFEKFIKNIPITDDSIIKCSYIDEVIISEGEELGILFIYCIDEIKDIDLKIVNIVISFLINTLDE